MGHKSLVVLGILVTTLSFAGGAAKPSLDGYFKGLAVKSGQTEENIRREAIEVLRAEKLYSENDLARIGRGSELHPYVEKGMINLLHANRQFRAKLAIASLRNDEIQNEVSKEFLAYKERGFEPTLEIASSQMVSPHSGVRIATARSLVASNIAGAEVLLIAGMKTETLSNPAMAEKVHAACVEALATLAKGNAELQLALLDHLTGESHQASITGIADALAKSLPSDPNVVERIASTYLKASKRATLPNAPTIRVKSIYGRMVPGLELSLSGRFQAALAEALYVNFDLVAMETLAKNGLRNKYLDAFLNALAHGPVAARAEAAKHLGGATNVATNQGVLIHLIRSLQSDGAVAVRFEAAIALIRLAPHQTLDLEPYLSAEVAKLPASYRSMVKSAAEKNGIVLN